MRYYSVPCLLLALALTGCSHHKLTNVELFQNAAHDLPSALRDAESVGLSVSLKDLDRAVPASLNAAETYLKAFKKLKNADPVTLATAYSKGSFLPDKAAALLAPNAKALDTVRKASAYKYCDFGPKNHDLLRPFPDVFKFKSCASLLGMDALLHIKTAPETSFQDVEAIVAIQNHIVEDPSWISYLLVVALQGQFSRVIEGLVIYTKGDPAVASRLRKLISNEPKELDLAGAITFEAAFAFAGLGDPQLSAEIEDPNGPDYEMFKPVRESIKGVPPLVVRDAFRARLVQYFMKLYVVSKRRDLTQALKRTHLKTLGQGVDKGDPANASIDVISAADCSVIYQAMMKYTAFRDTMLVGLNLITNRKPGQPWPSSLPKGTPDVFTDGPLRYKSVPEGFTVYSVGANLKDDGGAGVYPADDVAFRYVEKDR